MSWWIWVLLAWFALSLPAGILVGRILREGTRAPEAGRRHGEAGAPAPDHLLDDEESA